MNGTVLSSSCLCWINFKILIICFCLTTTTTKRMIKKFLSFQLTRWQVLCQLLLGSPPCNRLARLHNSSYHVFASIRVSNRSFLCFDCESDLGTWFRTSTYACSILHWEVCPFSNGFFCCRPSRFQWKPECPDRWFSNSCSHPSTICRSCRRQWAPSSRAHSCLHSCRADGRSRACDLWLVDNWPRTLGRCRRFDIWKIHSHIDSWRPRWHRIGHDAFGFDHRVLCRRACICKRDNKVFLQIIRNIFFCLNLSIIGYLV